MTILKSSYIINLGCLWGWTVIPYGYSTLKVAFNGSSVIITFHLILFATMRPLLRFGLLYRVDCHEHSSHMQCFISPMPGWRSGFFVFSCSITHRITSLHHLLECEAESIFRSKIFCRLAAVVMFLWNNVRSYCLSFISWQTKATVLLQLFCALVLV